MKAVWIRRILVLIPLGLVVAFAVLFFTHPTLRFYRARTQTQRVIDSICETTPAGIEPKAWRELIGAVQTSFGNGIFAPGYATPEQLHELTVDLRTIEQSQLPPVEKAVALWDRIGSTCPKAAAYNERFDYVLEGAVAYSVGRADEPMNVGQ